MTTSFFHGSPKQQRDILREKRANELCSWHDALMAQSAGAWERATNELLAELRAADDRKIDAFRATLPPHRIGWFDLLSREDQRRLAIPTREDTRTDFQKDRDDTDSHRGWSEN